MAHFLCSSIQKKNKTCFETACLNFIIHKNVYSVSCFTFKLYFFLYSKTLHTRKFTIYTSSLYWLRGEPALQKDFSFPLALSTLIPILTAPFLDVCIKRVMTNDFFTTALQLQPTPSLHPSSSPVSQVLQPSTH